MSSCGHWKLYYTYSLGPVYGVLKTNSNTMLSKYSDWEKNWKMNIYRVWHVINKSEITIFLSKPPSRLYFILNHFTRQHKKNLLMFTVQCCCKDPSHSKLTLSLKCLFRLKKINYIPIYFIQFINTHRLLKNDTFLSYI